LPVGDNAMIDPNPNHTPTTAAQPPAFSGRRPSWVRWRTLAIAVVLLILGVELTLRLAWGFGAPLLYQDDPDCGYLPAPSQEVRRLGALNSINSYSMRSPQISPHKAAGVMRVLFVGDSVTYGTTYLDQSKIFTSLVAQRLGAVVHGPVEVLNVSAGGWAPSNEVGYLRSRGTFDADLVIFVNNSEDLNQPFATADLRSNGPTPGHRPFCAIDEVLARYILPRLFASMQAHDAGSSGDAPADPSMVASCILAPLDEAQSICQKAHARFAVIYTPDRTVSERSDWKACTQLLLQWGQRRHVLVLDMSDQFLTQPFSYVYIDGLHLHPGGHELIAQRVINSWPQLMSGSAPPTSSP
jgi:hypothetical protein